VEREAKEGGSLRAGYRSVASKLAKSEEYVYQLYKQKPKADGSTRPITLDFSRALARHYAEGRPADWINTPPADGPATARDTGPESSATTAPTALWPFKNVSYRRFMALPTAAQREIDNYLESMVTLWENKAQTQTPQRKQRG
jgi:hypothetical protein